MGGIFGGGGQEVPREQRLLMDAQRRMVDKQTSGLDIEHALQRLLLARKNAQDPVFRAVQQMAFSRLPVFARQGISQDVSQPILEQLTSPPPPLNISRPRPDDADILGIARRRA